MRVLNLSLLFGAAALAVADSSDVDADEDAPREATYFNGKKVPPMLELTPDNWAQESKASKYLLVKHYSPYCPHCIDYAPTFQTLYEFYYTSSPAGNAPKNADFTSFYDFRFADINCVAYNDLCSKHQVASWPTTILYENGEPIKTLKGVKNMAVLSSTVEEALEKAKPGTRPAKIELPEPGDKSSPEPKSQPADEAASKGKASSEGNGKSPAESKGEGKAEAAGKTSESHAKAAEPAKSQWVPPAFDPPVQKKIEPRTTPNPNGVSVPLTAETFQSLVTMTQEPWFIKFYAPWCHHCLKMAPNWEQLAKEMKGRLNIGEVNCDAEPRLCKSANLHGYPTILFFRGGERVEYQGLRGLGDFVQYAEKAIELAHGVPDVDAESFKALEEKEDVIFLYFYDHATTSEDFMALERLPLSLIGRAKLVKTRDPKLYDRFKITTWPRLLVSREGRPTYYPPLSPREMRDTNLLLNWMKSVWLPLVPELSATNAREIMDGKIVVLGILNRENEDSFNSAIREMKSAANEWMDKQIQLFQLERQELRDAKQLRIEEAQDRGDERALRNAKNIRINMDRSSRKEVTFAWVDGAFWQRWIRTTYGIDAKDGDRVIINDEDNRRYWDQTSTGNPIVPSRTSILETLTKVTANPPKIKPKLTIGFIEKIFFDIKTNFKEHPYLSSGCVLGIAFGCLSWFRGSFGNLLIPFLAWLKAKLGNLGKFGKLRRVKGHFKLEDGAKEHKAPLMGAGANGSKVD
ncbi:thioredoxin-like protein [Achaetomium macrosporum]|uniref:Thioredoxin-like protein n=1 Tax=Achaetomium macrosporum TaxID=79813 RepID=A0AAN7C7Y4_9PEZI|nr:thioredoxin-like protein [Achaetomium macrosporum]